MKRLFFALWPEPEIRQALQRVSQLIPASDIKAVRPRNYHVTLVFLGNVDDATALLIRQRIGAISAKTFALSFDQLSYWRRPRVLCLSCSNALADYVNLAAALEQEVSACGLQIESQPYTPHITLARRARRAAEIRFEPILWRAETFCLVESCSEPGGVVYRVLQQWPLIPVSQ